MGNHLNTRTFNIISWVTVAIMITLSLLMVLHLPALTSLDDGLVGVEPGT